MRRAAALLIGAAALSWSCSRREPHPPRSAVTTPTRSLALVLAAHQDSLLAIPGVVGVAEGLCDGAPCLVVLAALRTSEIATRLPAAIEGYRVDLRVTGPIQARENPMSFTLTSGAFTEGASIPTKHTCDGPDVSPALVWSGAPPATNAFALIADDPDAPAGTWVHWVLFNLPGTTPTLPEGVAKSETLKELGGALQGRTDFHKIGYGGPCPPPGKPHRYFFKLYALDGPLSLRAGATKADVERAMQGHILAMAHLMGTYERRR